MNREFRNADQLTMTHTGLLPNGKGKIIHVTFRRGEDYVDMVLPSRHVLKSQGFDEGELAWLQLYLKSQEKEIIQKAKQLDHDMIFNL